MKSLLRHMAYLITVIILSFISQTTHANVDQVLSKDVTYECKDGTGVLTITLNGYSNTTYQSGQGECLEWGTVVGKETQFYGCTKYSGGYKYSTVRSLEPLLIKKFYVNHAGFIDTTKLLNEFRFAQYAYKPLGSDIFLKLFGVNESTFQALGYTLENVFNISGVENYFVPGCGCPDTTFSGNSIQSAGTYKPVLQSQQRVDGDTVTTTYTTIGLTEMKRGEGVNVGYRLSLNGNEWRTINQYHFIADTIDFKPVGTGIPESCNNQNACVTDTECRLILDKKEFLTTEKNLSSFILSNYGMNSASGRIQCTNPPMPNISCTAGSGALVIANTSYIDRIQKPYSIRIPSNIASQTGSCTLSYPETDCQGEKTETITITDRNACIPPGYPKPTCDIRLSQTNFEKQNSTEYKKLTFTGISDSCQIDEYKNSSVMVKCSRENGSMEYPASLYFEKLNSGTGMYIALPYTYFLQDQTCTVIYPTLSCGPGGIQTLTIGSGGKPNCGDGKVDSAYGETCDLGTQNGQPNSGCSISCTLVGDQEPICSSLYSGRSLPEPITVGYCSIGTPSGFTDTANDGIHTYSWQCNQGGKNTSCQARYIPPSCGDGKRNGGEICDWKDTISRDGWHPQYGCTDRCTRGAPGCGDSILDTLSGEQCDLGVRNGQPDTGCSRTCTLIGNPDPLCSPAYSGANLLQSITQGYCSIGIASGFAMTRINQTERYSWSCNASAKNVICNAEYTPPYCGDGKKNGSEECDPTDTMPTNWGTYGCTSDCKQQNTCIIDGKPVCNLSLSVRELEAGNTSQTIFLSGATGSCIIPKAPTVQCGAYPSITVVNTDTSRNNTPSFTLSQEILSQTGKCNITYPATSCSPLRTEELNILNTPKYLTGITVNEKQVCFQILNTNMKPILGLERIITTTLIFGENTYTGTTQKYLFSGNNIFDSSSVQYIDNKYCITTPNPNEGPGGPPPPGTFPVILTVKCTNIYTCAFTQPGGFLVSPKKCTGKLTVVDNDGVMYKREQQYKVVVTGPNCTGNVEVTPGTRITATGGTFSSPYPQQLINKSFSATILNSYNYPGNHPRGLSLFVTYTQPGGFSYGLTTDPYDWRDSPLSITGNRMLGVRVIGGIAGMVGNNANQNSGSIVTDVNTFSQIQNRILRNIAELKRNVNAGTVTNGMVYYNNGGTYSELIKSANTLIVYGNLTINNDIPDMKGIIVLKDAQGNNGNVIIGNNVQYINAVIFAEGMLRGEEAIAGRSNVSNQLVLKGALYSRNTIGGSADPANLFVYPKIVTRNADNAFMEDLNNVRSGIMPGDQYQGYTDPFIIHYDASILQNPPLGFQ